MKQLFIICLSLIAVATKANNVQLNNVSVINNTNGTGKVIQFTVSWENSWRVASTGNYDGVWLFFKFKDTDGKYYPINFTGTDILLPANLTFQIGNSGLTTGVGMFIFRNSLSSGNVNAIGVRAGITSFPGVYDVTGYAIEMVYIPQGNFYVGDGTDPNITNSYQTGISRSPYLVNGDGSTVTFGTSPGSLNDTLTPMNFSGNIPGFPTGYEAFWMMKYELSQGAYRDFLNTLTYAQQLTRFGPLPTAATGTSLGAGSYRQSIEIVTPGSTAGNTIPAVVGCDFDNDNIYNETTDGEWIAVTSINWSDAAAYLDWAGLRPMTELEYEKACRGPLTVIANELAWGTATYNSQALTLANPGLTTETITNPSSFVGNLIFTSGNTGGPVRGGIFANSLSTRISSGAGYYGVMDLSGNVTEYCVQTNTHAGRSFNGKTGDGILTSVGNANESFWPGINGSTNAAIGSGAYDGLFGVRSTAGIVDKGGAFIYGIQPVSTRKNLPPILLSNSYHIISDGIRGVRDAN